MSGYLGSLTTIKRAAGSGIANQGYLDNLASTVAPTRTGGKTMGGYLDSISAQTSVSSVASDADADEYLAYLRDASTAAKNYLTYLEGAVESAKDYLNYFESAKRGTQ
jgi:hypothetical protein